VGEGPTRFSRDVQIAARYLSELLSCGRLAFAGVQRVADGGT